MLLIELKIIVLQCAGVEFPPREENSVPLFTPPQTHPVADPASVYEEDVVQPFLQSDASGLSLPEIQNAQALADVLFEIIGALNPHDRQAFEKMKMLVGMEVEDEEQTREESSFAFMDDFNRNCTLSTKQILTNLSQNTRKVLQKLEFGDLKSILLWNWSRRSFWT